MISSRFPQKYLSNARPQSLRCRPHCDSRDAVVWSHMRPNPQALRRADQVESAEGDVKRDWYAPIVADAEAGFGGVLNAYELMKVRAPHVEYGSVPVCVRRSCCTAPWASGTPAGTDLQWSPQ